ncbi:conserved hypothetical protein [Pediculus humanus corporis]|uniref:Calponin-homology (CH) domain-containing protein n=1 Tax=Pediculus humanus subsp. corporis TaxID=121224 RepID=E0VA61_PEDHC|nr:uncharacterized protein Phum_PHUM027620 [Pediculus humanus corporis]EEB10267.1 conserved hypothetical protein [Pediculus humanus corporis]
MEEIYEWIDTIGDKIPFSRPKKNFARDFSDGVLVAELLKYFYPRIVELHNYPAANSYALKIENWNTMNRKVLSKLQLQLSSNIIEELSRANPKAVEKLLQEIKNKIESTTNVESKESDETLNSEFTDEIIKVPVSTSEEGEKIFKKMIPAILLEKKIAEIKKKDKAIALLQKKVEHLESLLLLKETRIHDLTTQLYKPERNEFSFKTQNQYHTSL